MKSRAPSGVGLKRIGVWMSRKPASSIVAADDPDHLRPQARCCAGASRGAGRASGSGGAASRRRPPRRAGTEAASSGETISSVVDLHFDLAGRQASGSRAPLRARRPRLRHRARTRCAHPCATFAASGARSGLTTSWQIPDRSRRSTKTSPPWSRLRVRPPGERDPLADVLGADFAAHQVTPCHGSEIHSDDRSPTCTGGHVVCSSSPRLLISGLLRRRHPPTTGQFSRFA